VEKELPVAFKKLTVLDLTIDEILLTKCRKY
jgi:hypothetical protein